MKIRDAFWGALTCQSGAINKSDIKGITALKLVSRVDVLRIGTALALF